MYGVCMEYLPFILSLALIRTGVVPVKKRKMTRTEITIQVIK